MREESWKKSHRLDVKVALMGASYVVTTALALVLIAVWQSGQYNALAQGEVDALLDADLEHLTQSVYNLVRTENEAVQTQVDYNLNVARHLLDAAGAVQLSTDQIEWTTINQYNNKAQLVSLPKFLLGSGWLGKNTDLSIETPIVDEVTRLVGETATIFQRLNERGDMLRVATTVQTTDGKRAIGTYIPAVNPNGTANPVISTILRGETYHGRAYVVNAWYLTAYEPIYDSAGALVGMLYVGIKQQAVADRIRHVILETKVGKTGYVYVLGGVGEEKGHYIISNKGERDGENVWHSRDSDGKYVIQYIIERATQLKLGQMTSIRYRWQNPGEAEPRWKIAQLAYYKPWDWVIGTSVYEDELQIYRSLLSDGRTRMIRIMSMAAVLITVLVGLLGVLISWTIIRPVRQMTRVAEKIIGGDLHQFVVVQSKDEIGVLAHTFNLMTQQLQQSIEDLRQSEEKYRSIVENALEGLFRTNLDGSVISANPAMATILGYATPADALANVTDLRSQAYVKPEARDELLRILRAQGTTSDFEVEFYRRDRSKIWVSVNAKMVRDEDGHPAYIEGFLIDISARKHAEEDLAESRNYLDEIFNAVADPMLVKDSQHRWVLVNNALCAFLGLARQDILHKSDSDFFSRNEARVVWAKDELVLQSGVEDINEETLTDAKGGIHTVVTRRSLYSDKHGAKFVVGIIRDVTEQKRIQEEKRHLESRLVQAQKMEAIGTLAGGIAHDFNNLLSAIIGFSEMAAQSVQHDATTREDLEQVLIAADRARELVKQILTFSRMTETQFSPLSLKNIVSESLKMLRSVIPSSIEIKANIKTTGLVLSNPTQIHQIMMNLCTNASHAMEEDGGVLTVTLEDIVFGDAEDAPDTDLTAGAYVVLSIRDTGKGIDPQITGKIFEPYFTTKEPGRGTGLGLSVIHGIVKSHNGAITCTSVLQQGTTFKVYLPRLEKAQISKPPANDRLLPVGHERILFVDDEQALAKLVENMLGSMGYKVKACTSSIKALELFRDDPHGFDLVITDLTMPGMTGDSLTRELVAIRPDIPVVLCTGYYEKLTKQSARESGIKELIFKPLDMRTLTTVIRKVLDEQ